MYEVALFGEFFSRDLKAILNRITLHSESSHPMHSREIIFEPLDAQLQREGGSEPVLLRAKKELGESGTGWNVFSLLEAEKTNLTSFTGFCTRISSPSRYGLIPRRP